MNKFAAILLLAVAASAQLVLANPIDDEEGFSAVAAAANLGDDETDALLGDEKLFSDFCHQERDYIANDIRQNARGLSSYLFTLFFKQAAEIGQEVVDVEKQAVEELAQQIKNPEQEVSVAKLTENEISALIIQGKLTINSKLSGDSTYGLVPATLTALSAVRSVLDSALFRNIAKIRTYMNANTLVVPMKYTCSKVAEYERLIAEKLENTKAELASSAAPEVQKFLSTVNVNNLHCQTTKSVVRINAFCELITKGNAPFLKMFGISLKD